MKYTVRKIWMGHVSIRDYILKKAIKNKEDLEIEFEGQFMIVPNRALKTYLTNTYNTPFKSKFGLGDYLLIDIPWKPMA